jgi:phage nucleotide-binding protein
MATRTRPAPASRSKIQPISSKRAGTKILVYGESGAGKTVLAASSPNALILDADNGMASAAALGMSCDVWSVKDYRDLDEAYDFRRRSPEAKKYDWLWLDSATLFQELGMDQIMQETVKRSPHRDPYVPDRLEYVRNQNHLSNWVRHMKALPGNFGITALVTRIEDEDGDVMYVPAITGGGKIPMYAKMCGYMDVVGRLYVTRKKGEEERHRLLQTQEDGKYYAKDRFNVLGQMRDPSIPTLTDTVMNGRRRKTTNAEGEVRRKRIGSKQGSKRTAAVAKAGTVRR